VPALADVSSTFDWTLRNDPAALGSWTIQNTRRTFRVTQVLVTGTAGLTVTVRKNTGAGAQVSTVSAGVATVDGPSALTEANTVFTATDNLHITASGGVNDALTKIIIRCVAGDAQNVPVV
jgi:hypothetical protein